MGLFPSQPCREVKLPCSWLALPWLQLLHHGAGGRRMRMKASLVKTAWILIVLTKVYYLFFKILSICCMIESEDIQSP